MTLNLSVISADLLDRSGDPQAFGAENTAKTRISPSPDRKLRFPVIYDGEICPRDDRLYIAKAESLNGTIDLGAHPSFLCAGPPPDGLLKGLCDMVIVSQDTKINNLLEKTSEIFDRYNAWETALKNIIIQNQNIKMLGLVSGPIFDNPLRLSDKNYKCIFSIVDKNKYKFPNTYIYHNEGEYLDAENTNAIENALYLDNTKRPLLAINEVFGYRVLRRDIFIGGKLAGALLVDEINRTFTDRDFTLITVLADAIEAMIPKTETAGLGRARNLEEILKKMTGHRPVNPEQLDAALAEMNWNIYDTCFCVTVESEVSGDTYSAMVTLSLKLSAATGTECYLIQKNTAVFVFNLTAPGVEKSAVVKTVLSALKNSAVKIGVSNSFSNFNTVYYYYRQTLAALEQGREKAPSRRCYYFDDYILDSILRNSHKDMVPEALYPEGFLALERHDRLKGTNYADTLEAFLERNMNIADTIKKIYMHRNTFLYRIGRIKELLDMDLDDPDTRLLLRIILKLRKKNF
jgi:phage FluMu protein gp41